MSNGSTSLANLGNVTSSDVWKVRVLEGCVTGGLWLLIVLNWRTLGWNMAELALVAMMGGRALRIAVAIFILGGVGTGKYGAASLFLGAACMIFVVAEVAILTHPVRSYEPAKDDAQHFGLQIVAHLTSVPEHTVPGTPRLADAGVAGGTAVPVVKYRLAGATLILAVRHDLTCPLRAVVVGTPAPGQPLPVLVVASPSDLTSTPGTGGPPRCDADGMLVGYDAVDLPTPVLTAPPAVIDVGAHGAATPVN